MHIQTNSSIADGLLLVGIPLAGGRAGPEAHFALQTDSGRLLPTWSVPRAFWPDGSIKWLWVHGRAPAGDAAVELRQTNNPQWPAETSMQVQPRECRLAHDGLAFVARPGEFLLACGETSVKVQDNPSLLQPQLAADFSQAQFELLEPSPLAPLVRLVNPPGSGLRLECLLRIDPLHQVVHWTRRVSFPPGGPYHLRAMGATLTLADGPWRIAGLEGSRSLLVHGPHRMRIDDEAERAGNPEAMLAAPHAAAWLVKGWQRAPFGLHAEAGRGVVDFYPETAEPLVVLEGTSFRHDLHVAVGPEAERAATAEVRWSWDSRTATATGALGPLAPRSAEVRRLFPGFDSAFEDGIRHCRLTRLDKPDGTAPGPPGDLSDETTHDEEFFGLQHYGDWPMRIGSYGGARRMYCDNEYDIAYALFQHFARTGNWETLQLARHSAVHMTDVDFIAHLGEMRFHGYAGRAEDHQAAREITMELGHVWTDGYWCLYFLFGDPFARDAAVALTQKVRSAFDGEGDDCVRRHFTGCERAVGWPMVAMCATMEAQPEPETLATLEKMSRYVAKYLADPDAEYEDIDTIDGRPANWWRCAAQDGCKPFMLGILMEGLERYHRLSGSAAAGEAIVAIAQFLRDVMWQPLVGAFIYELNAYNRRHRDTYPHYINLLVTRGLAYAYGLTGDESLRRLTVEAAYGGLWTAFGTTGGKEIGMVGRTSGATVASMLEWHEGDEKALAAAQPESDGKPFEFQGTCQQMLAQDDILLLRGSPRCDADGALICAEDSFAICRIETPWATNSGRVALEYSPRSAVEWDGSGSEGSGWAIFHVCDEKFTASAITVMHFYDELHVRFYDRGRKLIEVLEASVQGWPAGLRRRIEFAWSEREAVLWMDGAEVHRVPMQRRISGRFRKLYLGCKPGNWLGKGALHSVEISTE